MHQRRIRVSLVLVLVALVLLTLGGIAQTKTVLTFQHSYWAENTVNILEQMVNKFEQDNPTYEVKLSYVPWGQWESIVLSKMIGGKAPDVIHALGFNMRYMLPYDAFVDVTKYLDEGLINREAFFEAGWDEVSYDGKLMGFPVLLSNSPTICYNVKSFESAGVAAPPVMEAWTWKEAAQAAQKLTKDKGADGVVDQWGWAQRASTTGFTFYKMWTWHFWGNKTDIVKKSEEGKWVSAFDTEATRESFQFFYDLIFKDKVMPTSMTGFGFQEMVTGFGEERFAMVTMGDWFGAQGLVPNYPNMKYGRDFDFMLLPVSEEGNEFSPVVPHIYHISKQSKQSDGAAMLLAYLFDRPSFLADMNWSEGQSLPGMKASAQDPRFLESDLHVNKIIPWLEQYGFIRPKKPDGYAQTVATVCGPIVQEMIVNELDAESTMERLDKAINEAFAR